MTFETANVGRIRDLCESFFLIPRDFSFFFLFSRPIQREEEEEEEKFDVGSSWTTFYFIFFSQTALRRRF